MQQQPKTEVGARELCNKSDDRAKSERFFASRLLYFDWYQCLPLLQV